MKTQKPHTLPNLLIIALEKQRSHFPQASVKNNIWMHNIWNCLAVDIILTLISFPISLLKLSSKVQQFKGGVKKRKEGKQLSMARYKVKRWKSVCFCSLKKSSLPSQTAYTVSGKGEKETQKGNRKSEMVTIYPVPTYSRYRWPRENAA